MRTQPVSGLMTAADSTVVLSFVTADTEALVVLSGSYTDLVVAFEATREDNQSIWFPVLATRQADLVTKVSSPNGFSLNDGETQGFRIAGLQGCTALRVRAVAIGSGVLNVQMESGNFFGASPVHTSVGLVSAVRQCLFQLQQITNLLGWLKEPSGAYPPVLAGGDLHEYLDHPGQYPSGNDD